MINLTSILAGLSSIFPEFLFGYFGGMELQLELQYKSRVILGNFCFQVVEFLVIDLIVEGVGRIVTYASTEFRRIQTGNVGYYIFIMVISIAVILAVSLRTWIL